MSQDKQFEPTARRRSQARQKGQVPRSRDLTAAGVLLLVALFAPALFGGLSHSLVTSWTASLGQLHEADLTAATLRALLLTWGGICLRALAPILLIVIAGSVALTFAQSGLTLSTYPLQPRLDKLNPATALKRILSVSGLVETAKSLLKIVLVALVAWIVLRDKWSGMLLLGQMEPAQALAAIGRLAWELTLKTALVMAILGAADYFYQRFEHNKSLRMSREDMRQETRETEGDPHVRAQQRQRRQQLLRDGVSAQLPQATVVLTNPTHVSVALHYKPGEAAPVVVARGRGRLAARIRTLARRYAIPVKEDPPLARALYQACPMGVQVPPALYRAVAVILAQVYKEAADRKKKRAPSR
ncbi:MAG: EscU/YscU/HrcU family type III secretion system export apparatus switch protein [Armatimonadia bacterium]